VKLSRVVLGSAVAVSLVGGGLMAMPAAAQDDCGVMINGGNVSNQTVIDLNANGGTGIGDASGGSNNTAQTGGGHAAGGTDTAASGNGGVATAAANGGAISTGDINSGGNVGNAISVGNTTCAPVANVEVAKAPKEEKAAAAAVGAEVAALPNTGVGIGDPSALFMLITSAGAAAASLGLRRR
jgi:hypothetical protein